MELGQSQTNCTGYKAEIKQLQEKLRQYDIVSKQQVSAVKQKLQSKLRQFNILTRELQTSQQAITSHKDTIKSQKSQICKLQQKLESNKELQDIVIKASKQIKLKDSKIEQLSEQLNQINQKLSEIPKLKQQLNESQHRYQALQQLRKVDLQEQNKINSKYSQSRSQIAKLNQKNIKLKTESNQVNKQLKEIQNKLLSKNQECSSLQMLLHNQIQQSNTKTSAIQKAQVIISRLNEESQLISSQNSKLSEYQSRLQEELQNARSSNMQMEDKIREYNECFEDNESMSSKIDQLVEQLKEKTEDIQSYAIENQRLSKENQQFNEKIKESEQLLDEMQINLNLNISNRQAAEESEKIHKQQSQQMKTQLEELKQSYKQEQQKLKEKISVIQRQAERSIQMVAGGGGTVARTDIIKSRQRRNIRSYSPSVLYSSSKCKNEQQNVYVERKSKLKMQGGTDTQNTISGLKVPINTTYNFEIIHEKNHDQFQNQALQPNYLSMTQQCSQTKIQQIKQAQQQNQHYKLAFKIAKQQNKQILQQMSKQKSQLDKILSQEILILQKKIQKSLINQTLQREKSSKLQMKCQQLQTQLYTLAKKEQVSTEILKELKGVIVQKQKFMSKYQQLFRFKLLHADNKVASYSMLLEEEIQFRGQYLIKQINDLQEEEVKLKEEIKCKSEKIEEMKIQEERMKSVVTSLKQDMQRLSLKIQNNQAMYDKTIKQTIELRRGFEMIDKLFSSRSEKQDEIQQQKRETKLQDKSLSAKDIEQSINKVREIIVNRNQMISQIEHLQKQNLILQQHQQASFQSNQQSQTQFADLRVKIRQLEYRNSQLSQELNFIQEKKQEEDNKHLNAQNNDFQLEEYKQRIQDLKHILQKKEVLINNLTLQIQSQNNVIANLRDEIFELQQNKDLTALRSDNTSLRYELDKVRSLNLQQVHKISQMQENMDALKNQRSNLVNQMQNKLQETADISKLLKQTKLQLQWQRRQMIAETKQPDLILEPQYQKSIDQYDVNRHSLQFSSISSGMQKQRTSKSIDSLASPQLRC